MSSIELRATSLHWLEDSDPFEDCCLHGAVYLKIGNMLVSDGSNADWTVSTAAYNLLRTVSADHSVGDNRPLIPHCGHTMWPIASEPDGLYLGGCDIGIDWNVGHSPNKVVHALSDKTRIETDLEDWRSAVCRFSDEVYAFFMTAYPKRIDDAEDREGFELFLRKWKEYRSNAEN